MSKAFRLAAPSEDSRGLEALVAAHFGHCGYFTIIELTEEGVGKVETVPNTPHVQGGCQAPVDLLAGRSVNGLVAGGMGMRPLLGFQAAGVKIFALPPRPGLTVRQAVDMYLGGLKPMTSDMTCGSRGAELV